MSANDAELTDPRAVTMPYTNYKGERRVRTFMPLDLARTVCLPYHTAPQWMLRVWDYDKKDERWYALSGFAEPAPEENTQIDAHSLAYRLLKALVVTAFDNDESACRVLLNQHGDVVRMLNGFAASKRETVVDGRAETLTAAIEYALELMDGSAVDWLRAWSHGEPDELKQLATWREKQRLDAMDDLTWYDYATMNDLSHVPYADNGKWKYACDVDRCDESHTVHRTVHRPEFDRLADAIAAARKYKR